MRLLVIAFYLVGIPCISISQDASGCVRNVGNKQYYIIGKETVQTYETRIRFELPPYKGKTAFEYREASESELKSSDSLITLKFRESEQKFMYKYDEYITQLLFLKSNGKDYTLGFFTLKSHWESEKLDACNNLFLPLDGGSSFIKFLIDHSTNEFLYFRPNGER